VESQDGGELPRACVRKKQEVKISVGSARGLAILSGISRSGVTASTLFRSDDPSTAFRLFLLLSIPASIGAAALTGGGGGIALIASLIAAAVPIG